MPNLIALQDSSPLSENVFNFVNVTVGSSKVQGIFKSAEQNTSIFGDSGEGGGIVGMLQSPIVVESWRGDNGSYCPGKSNSDAHHPHLSKFTHLVKEHAQPDWENGPERFGKSD